MNHYYDSYGDKYTQRQVDANIRKAKKAMLEAQREMNGFIKCVDCGINEYSAIIDCSHDVSVQHCKNAREVELAWDIRKHKTKMQKVPSRKGWIKYTVMKDMNNIEYELKGTEYKPIKTKNMSADGFIKYIDEMGYSWSDFDRPDEMENLIEQYAESYHQYKLSQSKEFKVLMYNGGFIDEYELAQGVCELAQGVYESDKPRLVLTNMGRQTEKYVENLKKCELKTVRLIIE